MPAVGAAACILPAMHADTIFVLEKVSVVESGSHAELVVARGLYYAMWRRQIGERPVPEQSQTFSAGS